MEDCMPRSNFPGLRPDAEWTAIVDDILGNDPTAHMSARKTMWLEVTPYVECIATLPSRLFAGEARARRDIAVRVLQILDAGSYFHLKEWRTRQRLQRDHAPWWAWIMTVSRCAAIEYARIAARSHAAPAAL